MHREDDSNYLLYIEPKKKDKVAIPLEDDLTQLMELALKEAKEGVASYSKIASNGDDFNEGSGYKGWHSTDCGEHSSNKDYLLKNGMITNSLAAFYVKYYRNAIPKSEMLKLNKLKEFYNTESNVQTKSFVKYQPSIAASALDILKAVTRHLDNMGYNTGAIMYDPTKLENKVSNSILEKYDEDHEVKRFRITIEDNLRN